MKKENTTLLATLDTALTEFRDYGAFYFEFLKDFRAKRASEAEFLQSNIGDEKKISDYILDYNTKPGYYAQDLDKLKERLITIFLTIQDIVEIPENVKNELLEISEKRNPILFRITDGKPEVVDAAVLEKLTDNARKIYEGLVKGFKQPIE